MSNTTESIVKEIVVGFTIASGLFYAAGTNPQSEVFKALSELLKAVNPDSGFIWLFKLLPILTTITMILLALMMGGIPGLIAIVLGFLGGAFLVWMPFLGVILCGVAILIGFVAFSPED